MSRKIIEIGLKKTQEENILFGGRTISKGPLKVTAKELDGLDLSRYPNATKKISIP